MSTNQHRAAKFTGRYYVTTRALRMAVEPDPRMAGIPSTKGTLDG